MIFSKKCNWTASPLSSAHPWVVTRMSRLLHRSVGGWAWKRIRWPPSFSAVAAPLTNLFTPETNLTFTKLKNLFVTSPKLASHGCPPSSTCAPACFRRRAVKWVWERGCRGRDLTEESVSFCIRICLSTAWVWSVISIREKQQLSCLHQSTVCIKKHHTFHKLHTHTRSQSEKRVLWGAGTRLLIHFPAPFCTSRFSESDYEEQRSE